MDTNVTLTLKDVIIVGSFLGSLVGVWMKLHSRIQRLEDTNVSSNTFQRELGEIKVALNTVVERLTRIEVGLDFHREQERKTGPREQS